METISKEEQENEDYEGNYKHFQSEFSKTLFDYLNDESNDDIRDSDEPTNTDLETNIEDEIDLFSVEGFDYCLELSFCLLKIIIHKGKRIFTKGNATQKKGLLNNIKLCLTLFDKLVEAREQYDIAVKNGDDPEIYQAMLNLTQSLEKLDNTISTLGQYIENTLLIIHGEPEPTHSIVPRINYILTSKAARNLPVIDERSRAGEQTFIDVSRNGSKGKKNVLISAYFYTDLEGEISITGRPLTIFDKLVHDAICTLYEAGNTSFTPEMVYRAMNGMTDSEKVSKESVSKIIGSIDIGTMRRLKIDATSQISRYFPKLQKYEYENYFLPLDKSVIATNGERHIVYRILAIPPLYDYSKNIKQVISVDPRLLDTRDKLERNSPQIAAMRMYLIMQIRGMKSNKSNIDNCCITYDKIFREADLIDLTQTERNRRRTQIKQILEHFKEYGEICGYEEYKRGRTYEGVKIIL